MTPNSTAAHSDTRPVRDKTIEELEGFVAAAPGVQTHVVTEVHRLRKLPLKRLRIEDLRLLIGQDVARQYLVPLALDHLDRHPFAAGDFYKGDLLLAVARVSEPFWTLRPHLRRQLITALQRGLERIHKVRTVPTMEADLKAALQQHEAPLPPGPSN